MFASMLPLLLPLLIPLWAIVCCKKKAAKSEAPKPKPTGSKEPSTDKTKWSDQEVNAEVDRLEKTWAAHDCKTTEGCKGCASYITGIETLWSNNFSDIGNGGKANTKLSQETRTRVIKKHTEIGETFDLMAGTWTKRPSKKQPTKPQLDVEKTQHSKSKASKGSKEKGKTLGNHSADKISEEDTHTHLPPLETRKNDGKEPSYENLCPTKPIITQETQDSLTP